MVQNLVRQSLSWVAAYIHAAKQSLWPETQNCISFGSKKQKVELFVFTSTNFTNHFVHFCLEIKLKTLIYLNFNQINQKP